MGRIGWGALAAVLVSGAAWSDVPRLDLSVGLWDHDVTGALTSDDPLLAVPPGFELGSEREPYARFGVRLGDAWWAPVVRARYTALSGQGASFVDDSTYLGNVLITLDTTSTRTEVDFQHLEGLLYFTFGSTVRGEFGGGIKRFDGGIETVQVNNTTLDGEVTTRAQRDLPAEIGVVYGGAYAEPASWLSFGGEYTGGSGSGTDVSDLTFRFILKPLTWMGVEGGYRRLTLKGQNHNNTDYDFEFGGPYAGLSFLYGSKAAGLLQPDSDGDGVYDKDDQCPDTRPGAVVSESGCEPDSDGDGVPDAQDRCADTPAGADVDARGCPIDSDGDGIPDGLDDCPDTSANTRVDARGCPEAPEVSDVAAPPAAALSAVPATGPDADGDGVPDAMDRCPGTPQGFKVDASGCLVQQQTVLQGITFQLNSSYLMRDSEVLLHQVVEALKADTRSQIVIQGHTCDLGDARYNKWLSQRRANRVLEFLVRHGIDASRLLAVGYGEDQPLVPNDDERMRELNRRTVFQVMDK
jgi:OmpA-OmpF porin, OOP family